MKLNKDMPVAWMRKTCGVTSLTTDKEELDEWNVSNDICGGYDKIIPLYAHTNPDFISVTERLPKLDEEVLLYDTLSEGWVIGWRCELHRFCSEGADEWYWAYQIHDLNAAEMNITHWVPLPKPPKT